MIRALRTMLARRRLARMVETNRTSYEIRRFRERRAAMLRHTRGTA